MAALMKSREEIDHLTTAEQKATGVILTKADQREVFFHREFTEDVLSLGNMLETSARSLMGWKTTDVLPVEQHIA